MKVVMDWPDDEIEISCPTDSQAMHTVQCIIQAAIRANVTDPAQAECHGLCDETVAYAARLLETDEISKMSIADINKMMYDWGWTSTIELVEA